MGKPKKAYKRFYDKYEGLFKDTTAIYDDFDGEFITLLTPDTTITIQGQYSPINGIFIGYNVYADGKLLETFWSKKAARKFIKNLGGNIEK